MKRTKRVIAAAVFCCLLAGVAVGCGQKTEQTDSGQTYNYTMTMYQTEPANPDSVLKKEFEERFGVTVDVWDIEWQKYDEILNLKMAGGEVPDIIYVKTAQAAQKYVDQDIAAPIPLEDLERLAPNMLKRINDDSEGQLKYYYIDDELYSLPSYSVGAGASGIPMVWRGDWLKNVGIDKVPETLDEYEEAFYKFAKEDPDGNGKDDTYGLSRSGLTSVFAAYGFVPSLGQTGTPQGYWHSRDGQLVYSAIQPEMKTALERIHQWYVDGVLDPEFITGENKGGYWAISHQFINGIIGFTSHGMSYHWEPLFYVDADPSTSGQDRYELSKLNKEASDALEVSGKPPKLTEGEQPTYPPKEYVRGERWMFSKDLLADQGKWEKLLSIYNEMYSSKETFDEISMGKKGVVWDYEDAATVDGNTYQRTIYLGDWKDQEYRNDNTFNFRLFSPNFLEAERVKTPRDDWADPKGFNMPYFPYNELYINLPSTNRYNSELTKIEDEAYVQIITGDQPIDYFDEFVEKWRASGGAQLEKEAQEWFDEVNQNQS